MVYYFLYTLSSIEKRKGSTPNSITFETESDRQKSNQEICSQWETKIVNKVHGKLPVTYDGAGNMAGIHKGCATRIQERYPNAKYILLLHESRFKSGSFKIMPSKRNANDDGEHQTARYIF